MLRQDLLSSLPETEDTAGGTRLRSDLGKRELRWKTQKGVPTEVK